MGGRGLAVVPIGKHITVTLLKPKLFFFTVSGARGLLIFNLRHFMIFGTIYLQLINSKEKTKKVAKQQIYILVIISIRLIRKLCKGYFMQASTRIAARRSLALYQDTSLQ